MSELANIIARLTDILKDLQILQGGMPINRQANTVHVAESSGTFDESYSFIEPSTCCLSTGDSRSLCGAEFAEDASTVVMPKIISKHDVIGFNKKLEEYKRDSDKAVEDAKPKIPYQEEKLDDDSIAQKVEEYKRALCKKA
jgi:hypothetical protein